MQTIRHTAHRLAIFLLMAVALIAPAQTVHAADTEIAHIWRFTYQHSPGTGTLEVMVVEHDKLTHEIITVLQAFTYAVPCTPAGNGATCDLDIRSALQDAYIQMDRKEEAAKVRAAESYRWMIVEATGTWSSAVPKAQTVLAAHPSLQFAVATPGGNSTRFTSGWNSHNTTSQLHKTTTGVRETMTNKFSCVQNGPCTSENYVMVSQRKVGLGSTNLASSTTVGFQLAPAQIRITVPAGFQLESFVIDPPKAGYG